MLENYLNILLCIGICFSLGLVLMGLAFLRSEAQPNAQKKARYECGFDPLSPVRFPVDIRFALVAILFIIFDVEVIFLFPWAMHLKDLGWVGFGSVVCFLTLLTLGFVYEWVEGALEWS